MHHDRELKRRPSRDEELAAGIFPRFSSADLEAAAKVLHKVQHGAGSLSLLDNKFVAVKGKEMTQDELNSHFIPHDVQRLESYIRNQIEYRMILDLTNDLSSLYFQMKLPNAPLDALQKAILMLGIGSINKTVDQLAWINICRQCLKNLIFVVNAKLISLSLNIST